MNEYVEYFHNNNKYMNHFVHDKKWLKNYNDIWNKISNLLKKGLIVNQCIMINTLKLKVTIIDYIQILIIIKYQKIMNMVHVYL